MANGKATLAGGQLIEIENCFIEIPPFGKIKMKALPEISDSFPQLPIRFLELRTKLVSLHINFSSLYPGYVLNFAMFPEFFFAISMYASPSVVLNISILNANASFKDVL